MGEHCRGDAEEVEEGAGDKSFERVANTWKRKGGGGMGWCRLGWMNEVGCCTHTHGYSGLCCFWMEFARPIEDLQKDPYFETNVNLHFLFT